MKKVSIIILQYNNPYLIDHCLKSIYKTKYKNYEIIVIDNNSKDNSVQFLKKHHNNIKLIESKTNLGYTGGNNLGLKHANGDYIVFLNNDTTVHPDWLTHLTKETEKHKAVAAQPKVLKLKNPKYFEYAGASGGFIDIYGYPYCRGRVFNTIEKDNNQYNNTTEIFWACGVCLFIKRKILNKIGSFDPSFFLYFEEEDLCWRLHLQKQKIIVAPEAMIYHLGEATAGKKPFKKYYYFYRNYSLLLFKNYSIKNLLHIIPIKTFLDFLSLPYFFYKKEFNRCLGIITGNLSFIFTFPRFLKNRKQTQKLRLIKDNQIKKLMLNKSLVIEYFLNNKKYYSQLK